MLVKLLEYLCFEFFGILNSYIGFTTNCGGGVGHTENHTILVRMNVHVDDGSEVLFLCLGFLVIFLRTRCSNEEEKNH